MKGRLDVLRFVVIVGAMAVLSMIFISVPEAYGATVRTIEVDSIADDHPEQGCTLREAIDVANAGLLPGPAPNGCVVTESGGDPPVSYEINLPGYMYTLTGAAGEDGNLSGDLDIIANMTINGQSAGNTIIDGGGIDRVFHLPISGLDITFMISNVTVQNGYAGGDNNGGGILSVGGKVIVSNSTVRNNIAGRNGGGIYNDNPLVISNSLIADNEASLEGGGIYGGIYIDNTLTISNSIIANNSADYGGGIFGDSVTIDSSTITQNEAVYKGGGIVFCPRAHISNTTIINNIAGTMGGGISSHSGAGCRLNVISSTIADNEATNGGGIYMISYNILNIANSTVSGNQAKESGGGIYGRIQFGVLNLTNVTVTNNIADSDEDGSGSGGGIYKSHEGAFNIKQSIVSGNTDLSGSGPDCYGIFVSYQYNLIGINTGCVASFPAGLPNGNNDYVGTGGFPLDPKLGGVTGEPFCYMLQLSSVAVDKVPGDSCTYISTHSNPLFIDGDPVTTDQLGTARDSTCDIGAYEVPAVGIQVLDGVMDVPDDTGNVDFGSTLVGIPITKTFTVLNIGKTSALTLSNLSVPAGFSIASDFGSTTVVTGTQTTFEIQLDATEAITYSGQLSFTNNVENRNPFNFNITGTSIQPIQLSLSKTASLGTVTLGQEFTYTLVISNVGIIDAANIIVSDTIPVDLEFIGPVVIDPPNAGTPGIPPILVSDLTVDAGELVSISYPVKVNSGCDSVITNTASVTSTGMLKTEMSSVDINVKCADMYLPLVSKASIVDILVTSSDCPFMCYPCTCWMYGYVQGHSSTPVYSTVVGVDVTDIPYCEPPDECEPYDSTRLVNPAFPATLPGQINPFSWSETWGKHSISLHGAHVDSASVTNPGSTIYYPLTVVNWNISDKVVTGTVRNDSGQVLQDVRVVVTADECAWKEAALTSTTLQPAQETDFLLDYFYCENNVNVLGQGKTEP